MHLESDARVETQRLAPGLKSWTGIYFRLNCGNPLYLVLCLLLGIGTAGLEQVWADDATQSASLSSTICTFDARPWRKVNMNDRLELTRAWDNWHVLSALQGLANRDHARLYVFYCNEFGIDTDQFWFDWLKNEDGWLKTARIETLSSLDAVLDTFRAQYQGLVVYDGAVPATANAASTIAGCDSLLPVRFDLSTNSLYYKITQNKGIPVKMWLVQPDGTSKFTGKGRIPDVDLPSSGSAKADVYRWALAQYLPKCNPAFAGYYIDSHWIRNATNGGVDLHTLCNQDYFMAHKAFFFDLSPWGDEKPNDDPGQALGLDRAVFLEVMGAMATAHRGGMIKVGGFPPWPYKYTDHGGVGGKHGGVPTEWEFGRLISQYNGYMEADAAGLSAMANASFFQHYPLAGRYPQKASKPTAEDWERRGLVTPGGKVKPILYVGHYGGDYDSAAWLYKAVPAFMRDPALGKVPVGWAFNPNLADRAPQAMVFARRMATTNDWFIAGDSGAGYLNARALTVRPESKLSPGLDVWARHCERYYRQWDISITGFILDGSAGASTTMEYEAYRRFSSDGAGTHFEAGPKMLAGIPTCPEVDLPDQAEAAASVIAQRAQGQRSGPAFLWARSILKSPGWYARVSDILREKHPEAQVEVVDPHTFFGLIKVHLNP